MSVSVRSDHVGQLIEQFYEGALTDEGWGEALHTATLVTGSPQASIVVFDPHAQVTAIHEIVGATDEALAAYNRHFHLLDEALPFAASIPLGGWYLDRRDLGERAMRRSAYYQDFLLRHDMATTVCNRLLGDGSEEAYLSLQRRPGQPHYTDADLAAFRQFIPHVQRAARIRMHMQRQAQRAGLANVVLDRLCIPLIVLDEQRQVLVANAEAEALMRRQPLLQMRHGHLLAQGLRAGQLDQLVHSACGRHGPAMAGGALVMDSRGQPALQWLVLPLPAKLSCFNQWARPLALVVLHDLCNSSPPYGAQQHLLQQIYGLTPAEARIALAVCQGDTPAQAARRTGVGIGTVRTQLRAIFAKTETSGQAELIRLLAALWVAQ
ncbi:MAG: helix-turn-helix transcriptional regulator [Comamonadaceae bacterium]|nr:helix-turn-helix transcriptional regulator [Comamonadaceae bacterium]